MPLGVRDIQRGVAGVLRMDAGGSRTAPGGIRGRLGESARRSKSDVARGDWSYGLPSVSVGQGGLDLGSIIAAVPEFPTVLQRPGAIAPIPSTPTGLDITSDETIIRPRFTRSHRSRPVVPVTPVTVRPPPVQTGPTANGGGRVGTTSTIGGDMSLDLGSLLGSALDIYGQIVTNRQAPPQLTPISFNPQALVPFSGVPMTDVFIDPVTGQVCEKKKRRRRRRRLATPSDIKDLAALSAVTTPSEKKTWIATHPS